ncbi:MAG: D-tyrosyl-tRNA(Tyr) deacylase [Marinospirillum sp.]|uniref:D-aminoacyl-tRNA deacylase n=1 Tax=Marinospirillum sp. TaxID=2183934 RepID=UPI001A089301|nr:D-aminoacyl-tRNA deacylase [Marinospirillum sp.]MBE0505219.1 D-tyrosyl-tRNA(Tyr) deacylase [Marinospirillum sp.]
MKALIQRVTEARVDVSGQLVGQIKQGLLVFLGVEKRDTEQDAEWLLNRLLHYRIFADEAGKMNLGLQQSGGGLLIVSQFTLAADTRKGLRPGFSSAADPTRGELLYNYFLSLAHACHSPVASGRFGANMQVQLTNDGPVTFMLESPLTRI